MSSPASVLSTSADANADADADADADPDPLLAPDALPASDMTVSEWRVSMFGMPFKKRSAGLVRIR